MIDNYATTTYRDTIREFRKPEPEPPTQTRSATNATTKVQQ